MKFEKLSFDEQQIRMSTIGNIQLLGEKLNKVYTFTELKDLDDDVLILKRDELIIQYNALFK